MTWKFYLRSYKNQATKSSNIKYMYWKKSNYWRESEQTSFLSRKQICDKGRQVTEKINKRGMCPYV